MRFFYNDGTTAGGPTLDGGGRSKTQRTPRIRHEGRLYRSKAKTLAGRDLRSHQLGQENPSRRGATTFAALRAFIACSSICGEHPNRRYNVGRNAGCTTAVADCLVVCAEPCPCFGREFRGRKTGERRRASLEIYVVLFEAARAIPTASTWSGSEPSERSRDLLGLLFMIDD